MATTEKGIYYPDDGTKSADVLADLEQMAESVDEAIGKEVEENKYNDADIKKDISDIKKEQQTQNKNIEQNTTKNKEQDELISKLKSALINVETEEAKSLHIEDASEVPAQLKVMGNQEQKTREGYNLLENTAVTQTINGITFTVNDDGTVTVNGTATAQAVLKINQTLILENGNYKLNGCPEGGSSSTYRFRLYRTNTNAIPDIGSGAFFEITENIKFNYLDIAIEEGTKISNLVFKPMIIKGTEEKLYEPYGAMPSPDYLSEVVCLGSNKNLFDKNNASIISLNAINQENGTFATATNQKHVYIECEALTSYSITKSILADTTLGIYETGEIPAVNVNYHQLYLKAASTGIATVKTGENAKYLDIRLNSRALTEEELQEILDTLKIEEGTKATSYSPYEQGSTEIKKINKNFLISKEIDTTINGVKIVCNNGVVTLDGKATGSVSFDFDVFSLKKGIYKNTRGVVSGKATGSFQNYLRNEDGSYFIQGDESFELQEEKKLKYRFFANPNSVFEKYTMIPQVEKGLVSTTPETHKEKSKILPIQQEMLEGDYFVKEEDAWKEVHNWGIYTFSGTEDYIKSDSYSDDNWFCGYANGRLISASVIKEDGKMFATRFSKIGSYAQITNDNCIRCTTQMQTRISTEFLTENTAEAYENLLAKWNNEGNPLKVFYELQTPTKLPCTPEQSAVLDEIDNLDLFEGVNNIITAENIAKLKLKYVADTKTYVDNKLNTINQQILELAGGN